MSTPRSEKLDAKKRKTVLALLKEAGEWISEEDPKIGKKIEDIRLRTQASKPKPKPAPQGQSRSQIQG